MGEGESQDLLVQIFEERERSERARVMRKYRSESWSGCESFP